MPTSTISAVLVLILTQKLAEQLFPHPSTVLKKNNLFLHDILPHNIRVLVFHVPFLAYFKCSSLGFNIYVCYRNSNGFDVFRLAISRIKFVAQLNMMKILFLKTLILSTDRGSNRLVSLHWVHSPLQSYLPMHSDLWEGTALSKHIYSEVQKLEASIWTENKGAITWIGMEEWVLGENV